MTERRTRRSSAASRWSARTATTSALAWACCRPRGTRATASRGRSRWPSRLGSFHLLRADGVEPVLILDDVFAELDSTRRNRLAAGVQSGEQVLVTAAVGADVPEVLRGRRFTVTLGAVNLDE